MNGIKNSLVDVAWLSLPFTMLLLLLIYFIYINNLSHQPHRQKRENFP